MAEVSPWPWPCVSEDVAAWGGSLLTYNGWPLFSGMQKVEVLELDWTSDMAEFFSTHDHMDYIVATGESTKTSLKTSSCNQWDTHVVMNVLSLVSL